jgi:[ribosomal protein S18]-alanine N-acetyltransferase
MDASAYLPPGEPAGAGGGLPPGWTVDRLERSDLDEVLEVEEASFTSPWTRQMFEGELANVGISYGYVLRTPEWRVAAFCTVWVVVDEVHINNLAVRPQCRGVGAGRMLLEVVLRLSAGRGAQRATLEVRRSNTGALKLYERLGFTVAGIRANYYANPVEDALILWRDDLEPVDKRREEGVA